MGKKKSSAGVKTRSGRGVRIPDATRIAIEQLLRTGASNLEISRRHGVSEGSVRNIRKRLDAAEPSPVPEADAPLGAAATVALVDDPSGDAGVEAAIDGLEIGGDLRVLVRGLIGEAMKTAKMAADDRNSSAAAKALRDAIGALPGLIRLEKASAENVDAVSIPREVIDREIEAIYGRARTLASVEMCPRCGCELRMAAVGAARETNKDAK